MSNKVSHSNESGTERGTDKGFVALRKLSAVRGILNSADYSQTQKLILISFVSLSDDGFRNAFPNMKTLERYVGVKEERVRIAMRALDDPTDENRIVETRRRGRSKSNSYDLITPRLAQLIETARQEAAAARALREGTDQSNHDPAQNEGSLGSSDQLDHTEKRGSSMDDPLKNEGSLHIDPPESEESSVSCHNVDPLENEGSTSNDPSENGGSICDDPSENEGLLSLDKYINIRESLNRQTTVDNNRARETVVVVDNAGPSTDFDLEGKRAALLEAAAPVIDEVARSTTLADMTVVKLWLANGADFDLDILPAVRNAAFKGSAKGTKIHYWQWFHRAVVEHASARRTRARDLNATMAELAQVTAEPSSSLGLPATHEQLISVEDRMTASGDLTFDREAGKLSVGGAFLEELMASFGKANIEAACAIVGGDIAKFRQGGKPLTSAEIKTRIRGECANQHISLDKASAWGKRRPMDLKDIKGLPDVKEAVSRFFGKSK
ncbi:MAG: hypothetical protein JSR89_17065 [Proteobacteria bacterium]|nr:hypothetical protein [Pseudomonadota bacterium]